MSMARDVTDSGPAEPVSSSSRIALDAATSSGTGRAPSRRNSRRALTERALAEGTATCWLHLLSACELLS